MVDTSFATEDVNEEIRVRKGKIDIGAEELVNLAKGPITLEIYKEEEKPLKNVSTEGGRLSIRYSLRRQFTFID